jgi:predicted PurR-regulated permease PerM
MAIYTQKQRTWLITAITAVVGIFLLWILRDLLPAFLGAVVMYVLFRPFFGQMVVKWHWPRWLATLCVVLVSFTLLVLPFLIVGVMITEKVQELFQHTDRINDALLQVQKFIGFDFHDPKTVQRLISALQSDALGGFSRFLSGAGSILLTVSMLYFMLWFMLMNHLKFETSIQRFFPFTRFEVDEFAEELKSSTFGNVLGQGLICLVQAISLGIGFVIFDLPDPFFWATITFFISFLPVIGAPIVFVPAGLISLAYGETTAGYGIIIWGFLLVTNIDNLLRYFISKYFADTHPLITIIGVIAGIPVFGILGLVFGPLLISWFLLLLKIVFKEKKQPQQN